MYSFKKSVILYKHVVFNLEKSKLELKIIALKASLNATMAQVQQEEQDIKTKLTKLLPIFKAVEKQAIMLENTVTSLNQLQDRNEFVIKMFRAFKPSSVVNFVVKVVDADSWHRLVSFSKLINSNTAHNFLISYQKENEYASTKVQLQLKNNNWLNQTYSFAFNAVNIGKLATIKYVPF